MLNCPQFLALAVKSPSPAKNLRVLDLNNISSSHVSFAANITESLAGKLVKLDPDNNLTPATAEEAKEESTFILPGLAAEEPGVKYALKNFANIYPNAPQPLAYYPSKSRADSFADGVHYIKNALKGQPFFTPEFSNLAKKIVLSRIADNDDGIWVLRRQATLELTFLTYSIGARRMQEMQDYVAIQLTSSLARQGKTVAQIREIISEIFSSISSLNLGHAVSWTSDDVEHPSNCNPLARPMGWNKVSMFYYGERDCDTGVAVPPTFVDLVAKSNFNDPHSIFTRECYGGKETAVIIHDDFPEVLSGKPTAQNHHGLHEYVAAIKRSPELQDMATGIVYQAGNKWNALITHRPNECNQALYR